MDLISACGQLIDQIPIDLIPQHVKAHQDDLKEFHKLSQPEQLNVLMDKKVKQALSTLQYSAIEIERFSNHPLSFPSISYKGLLIQFDFTASLYSVIYKDKILGHWNKNRLDSALNDIIDWDTQEMAQRKVHPSQQQFIEKWASNYIGTGENLLDWNLRKHRECCYCCGPVETTEHILQCLHNKALECWEESFQQYETSLKKIGTSNILRSIILKEPHHWRYSKTPTDKPPCQ